MSSVDSIPNDVVSTHYHSHKIFDEYYSITAPNDQLPAVLRVHIWLMVPFAVILLPTVVLLAVTRSKLHGWIALASSLVGLVGCILGMAGVSGSESSHGHSGHSKLGFVLFFALAAQVVLGVWAKGWKSSIPQLPRMFHGGLGFFVLTGSWYNAILGVTVVHSFCGILFYMQCFSHFPIGTVICSVGLFRIVFATLDIEYRKVAGISARVAAGTHGEAGQEMYESLLNQSLITRWWPARIRRLLVRQSVSNDNIALTFFFGGIAIAISQAYHPVIEFVWSMRDFQHVAIGFAMALVAWLHYGMKPSRYNFVIPVCLVAVAWVFAAHKQENKHSFAIHSYFAMGVAIFAFLEAARTWLVDSQSLRQACEVWSGYTLIATGLYFATSHTAIIQLIWYYMPNVMPQVHGAAVLLWSLAMMVIAHRASGLLVKRYKRKVSEVAAAGGGDIEAGSSEARPLRCDSLDHSVDGDAGADFRGHASRPTTTHI